MHQDQHHHHAARSVVAFFHLSSNNHHHSPTDVVAGLVRKRRRSFGSTGGHTGKMVRFVDTPTWHEVPLEGEEQDDDVWYAMEYLQRARREEIKNNLRAQHFSATKREEPMSIECDTLTWRGLEDIHQKYDRQDKIHAHVQAVVGKYHSLAHPCTQWAQHSLCHFSRSMSKADLHKAVKLGALDAEAVYPDRKPSTTMIAILGKTLHWSLGGGWSSPTHHHRRKSFDHATDSYKSGVIPVMALESQSDHRPVFRKQYSSPQ